LQDFLSLQLIQTLNWLDILDRAGERLTLILEAPILSSIARLSTKVFSQRIAAA